MNGNFKTVNSSNGKSMTDLQEETKKSTQYLKELGYKVVEMYECEWRKMKQSNSKIKAFLQSFNVLKPMYEINDQTLFSAIQNDKLFGLISCDIETPDHLKSYFLNFLLSSNCRSGKRQYC